jgi:hypothetical protein
MGELQNEEWWNEINEYMENHEDDMGNRWESGFLRGCGCH